MHFLHSFLEEGQLAVHHLAANRQLAHFQPLLAKPVTKFIHNTAIQSKINAEPKHSWDLLIYLSGDSSVPFDMFHTFTFWYLGHYCCCATSLQMWSETERMHVLNNVT